MLRQGHRLGFRSIVLFGAFMGLGSNVVLAVDQDIDITATVAAFCTISGSTAPANDTLDFTPFITNGDIAATPTVKSYPVICSAAADVTLTSLNGGLSGPAAVAGFDSEINYTVSAADFVTISPAVSTATVAGTGASETLATTTTAGPSIADIDVTITPVTNTNPLVAGTYNDTLRISITPVP